ncbi:MAG: DMT family transporter [Flavobacteriaceae bacterium]
MTALARIRIPRVSPAAGIALVLAGAIGFGLTPLFARTAFEAGLTPNHALYYRYLLPALLFAPLWPRIVRRPRMLLPAMAIGAFQSLGSLGYYTGIREMPVALAGLIFFTFPLWTVVFSRLVFGLVPDRRAVAGAALVLAATFVILDPQTLAASPRAVAFCFVSPIAYAFMLIVFGHVLKGETAMEVTAGFYLGALVTGLAIFAADRPDMLIAEGARGIWLLLGFLLLTGLLPQTGLIVGAPAIGPSRTATIGGFELVVTLGCGWIALGEPAEWREVVGAVLILAAVALAATAKAPEPADS